MTTLIERAQQAERLMRVIAKENDAPPEMADLIAELVKEIEALRRRLREAQEDAKDIAAEARWQERQGEDYGSY